MTTIMLGQQAHEYSFQCFTFSCQTWKILYRFLKKNIQLFQLRLSPEQSAKVEYERERLLGIDNKWMNLLVIPSSLSRSYSTIPLCSGDNFNWNSCINYYHEEKNSVVRYSIQFFENEMTILLQIKSLL
jgi:hypothetical protein